MFDLSAFFLAEKGFGEVLKDLWSSTGVLQSQWQNYVMLGIACILVYLAIGRGFEPLLLLPIAFGVFIINIPGAYQILYAKPVLDASNTVVEPGGLFHYLYLGVGLVIFPPLIFLGIGAMTDFGPMIANPKSILIGGGAQLGVFLAFIGALLLGFTGKEAASIGIIGGADGPTAIFVTTKLAPNLLAIIAIAAYSYMALIPLIQPPIMKALTTKKERLIRMEQLRPVSKIEKICFPLAVTAIVGIILPASLPLLGMLMVGNLFRESGVVKRLTETASNGLINTVTILLGIIVGTKAYGAPIYENGVMIFPGFLSIDTLKVVFLGLFAFCMGTVGGVLTAKILNLFPGKKVNPLIGSAGVSAVPMAARVSQDVGRKYDPENYLLMHAMGPNVAGVIGSAIAAGVLIALFI